MKKYLFLMIAMLAMVTVFTSCSDDDEENNAAIPSELVGIWAEDPEFNSDDNLIWEFTTSGDFIYRWYYYKEIDESVAYSYTVKGNTMIASHESAKALFTIKTLTSEKLVMYDNTNDETFSLTRIKSLP